MILSEFADKGWTRVSIDSLLKTYYLCPQ